MVQQHKRQPVHRSNETLQAIAHLLLPAVELPVDAVLALVPLVPRGMLGWLGLELGLLAQRAPQWVAEAAMMEVVVRLALLLGPHLDNHPDCHERRVLAQGFAQLLPPVPQPVAPQQEVVHRLQYQQGQAGFQYLAVATDYHLPLDPPGWPITVQLALDQSRCRYRLVRIDRLVVVWEEGQKPVGQLGFQ